MFFPFRLAYYQLIGNPVRSLLTVLGMIAASTLVAWTVASYDGALAEFDAEEISDLLGKYDCFLLTKKDEAQADWLTPGTAPPPYFSLLERFCSIEVTCRSASGGRRAPRAEGHMTAPPPLKGLPGGIYLLIGTDASTPPRPLLQGSWLPPKISAEEGVPLPCVLGSSLARQLKLQLNEVFAAGSFAGSFPMQVVGIIEDADGGKTRELWKNAADDFQQPALNGIFVSWGTAEKMAGGTLSADYAAGKRIPGGKADIQDGIKLVDADLLLRAKQQSSSADSRLRMQSWTASGLSLLISFFIIFTSLSMGVEERVRQYALLRSVALTRKQLVQSILLESLFFALLGWLGGLLAGSTLLNFFSDAAILRNPLQRGSSPRLIGFWTILLTGCCSLVGALAAALLPAWRASRAAVLNALKPSQLTERRSISAWLVLPGLLLPLLQIWIINQPEIPELLRVKLYSLIGSPLTALGFVLAAPAFLLLCQMLLARPVAFLLHLPLPFLRSQFDANLWRSTGTVIALSLGLGFYMMVVIWSASLLKPFLPGKWLPDLFVTIVPGGIQPDDFAQIQQIQGIKAGRCLPAAVEQCPLADDITGSRTRQSVTRQDNITLIGMPVKEAFGGTAPLLPFEFLTNREEALEKLAGAGNYCLAPSFFCQLTGLKTGDSFQLISPDDPGKVIEYRIAGIIRLEGWHWFSKFSGTRRHFGRTAALLFTSETNVRKHFNLSRINYVWSDLDDNWDEQVFRRELQQITRSQAGQSFHVTGHGNAVIGEETIQLTSRTALLQSILGRTETVVSGMLRMPAMLLWIMSLAVANTALASIRVRRREIGIMRAVGLSNFALLRLLLGEAIMIGLSATLLSLAFGIFSGLCSAKMATYLTFFGGMGWNFALPWWAILKGALLTLAICLAAALIPALMTLRVRPLQLLKDDS